MGIFNKTTTNSLKLLLPAILLVVTLFSCQKDDTFLPVVLSTNVPTLSFVDVPISLSCTSETTTDVRWEMGDGTTYSGTEITHTFTKPGNYTVEIVAYRNNIAVSCIKREIQIVFNHKTYQSENRFYALRSFRAEDNSIILDGYIKHSELELQSAFLILDEKLNIVDTLYDYIDIISRLKKVVEIDNKVYPVNDDLSGSISVYPFKAAENTEIPNAYTPIAQVFNYASGLIHYYTTEDNNLYVDFYNDNTERLWTKTFSTEFNAENTYLFNINNTLYYISFDNSSDKLSIEKFKNVSISLQKEEYSLGIPASDRKILFVYNMPYNNSISLGIYSKSENKTFFYSIDTECALETLGNKEGLFNDLPLASLENNSVITKNGSKISRYSNKWELQNEKNLESGDFGICKIGSNLFMLFENLPEGLKLSYIDSQLNNVSFE